MLFEHKNQVRCDVPGIEVDLLVRLRLMWLDEARWSHLIGCDVAYSLMTEFFLDVFLDFATN
jgi:hypothetical protein